MNSCFRHPLKPGGRPSWSTSSLRRKLKGAVPGAGASKSAERRGERRRKEKGKEGRGEKGERKGGERREREERRKRGRYEVINKTCLSLTWISDFI